MAHGSGCRGCVLHSTTNWRDPVINSDYIDNHHGTFCMYNQEFELRLMSKTWKSVRIMVVCLVYTAEPFPVLGHP